MDLQPRLGYQSYRVKSDPSGFCVIARILEINPDFLDSVNQQCRIVKYKPPNKFYIARMGDIDGNLASKNMDKFFFKTLFPRFTGSSFLKDDPIPVHVAAIIKSVCT